MICVNVAVFGGDNAAFNDGEQVTLYAFTACISTCVGWGWGVVWGMGHVGGRVWGMGDVWYGVWVRWQCVFDA